MHEHVASLGSVADPASTQDRLAFWQGLHERIARLEKRIDPDHLEALIARVRELIPMVTAEEQHELLKEKAGAADGSAEPSKLQCENTRCINDAFETAQEQEVCKSLVYAMRSENKAVLAGKSGKNRTTLYRAFRRGRHPKLLTVLKVLDALDLRLECCCGQSDVIDENVRRSMAELNEGFKRSELQAVYDGFRELVNTHVNISALASQLAMSRTSLYRWMRSGRSPTLLSVMNLADALQLQLRVQTNIDVNYDAE